MSHFAEINNDGIVQRVIVAEQDFIDSGAVGDANNNSHEPDGGIALRKNYAGKGFTYDKTRDAFIEPKPYPSWLLNEDTCQWNPPTPYPDDGKGYDWDEDTTSWKEIE